MNQPPPIKISQVSKHYGEQVAVRELTLNVGEGELFGLIGPDGAGKTTLLRMVCTLLAPDHGSINVGGADTIREMAQVRERVGYMPQCFSLYQDLTVAQNLRFFADLFGVPRKLREQRFEKLYAFSRLEAFKARRAGALSGGMKQKLALSCALVHEPAILVLDEPTFGVDPVSRQEFWQILHELRAGGTAILVSTAYMDEADQCDRIALMHDGNIIQSGTPAGIKSDYPRPLYAIHSRRLRELYAHLQSDPAIATLQLFGDNLHASFHQPPTEEAWQDWQRDERHPLTSWQQIDPSVEDVFLEMMEADDVASSL